MLQIPTQRLKELLLKENLVTSEKFDALSEEAKRMGHQLGDLLISQGVIPADYFYNLMAQYLGVEKVDLAHRPINEDVLKLLDEDAAKQKRVVIFAKEADGVLDVAMEDPSNLETIEFLQRRLRAKIKPFLARTEDLERGFSIYSRRQVEDFKKIIDDNVKAAMTRKVDTAEEAAKQMPIISIVDNLLNYAVSLRGSDIHIEALEDNILIRFRIDGILHEIVRISKEIHPALVARIKLLSNLKLDEHFKPQDGRFRHKSGAEFLDVRVSIIPVFYGEKVEMRLLLATQKPLSFKEIGLLDDQRQIVEENIKKTFGIFLVCGPTGSGKTTTLYSILNVINKPEVNIVTVEDPIEYEIKYVNQTQVNPAIGVSFASGLRSLLRQDPNIIMVGEIRDEETAEIAVNAALTGHLVLSSLHTNDAATAVPRLIDMKVAPFLISSVLNAIIAQRLVRRICLNCIESQPISSELAEFLKKQIKEANPYTKIFRAPKKIEQAQKNNEVVNENEIRIPKVLYHGKGCASCQNTGYWGRIGIFEVMDATKEVRELVTSPDFSLDVLNTLARKQGMVTMLEDGLRKVELGMTTVEEVLRVIRE